MAFISGLASGMAGWTKTKIIGDQASQRSSGICDSFNSRRGFGFIKPGDGTTPLFVHRSEVKSFGGKGSKLLEKGDTVEFDVVSMDDGRRKATNVFVTRRGYTRYRRPSA